MSNNPGTGGRVSIWTIFAGLIGAAVTIGTLYEIVQRQQVDPLKEQIADLKEQLKGPKPPAEWEAERQRLLAETSRLEGLLRQSGPLTADAEKLRAENASLQSKLDEAGKRLAAETRPADAATTAATLKASASSRN